MVEKEKLILAGDPVGLLPDGSINIGTLEEMKAKFAAAKAESEAAEAGQPIPKREPTIVYGDERDERRR
jgi:hypothetical protein